MDKKNSFFNLPALGPELNKRPCRWWEKAVKGGALNEIKMLIGVCRSSFFYIVVLG